MHPTLVVFWKTSAMFEHIATDSCKKNCQLEKIIHNFLVQRTFSLQS